MKGIVKALLKTINIIFYILIVFFIVSAIVYFYISHYTKDYIFSKIENLPFNEVGLVLGTSPVTREGHPNLFFINRMEATRELFDFEKISYVLVSGDNQTVSYNEPKYMRNFLLKLNIDEYSIVSDYGGRRTLDSVLRSNEIFNQNKITIISQKYHNERAIFIARKKGINAVAYNAKYPYPNSFKNLPINIKIFLRELLARDLAVLDILTNKKPAILGESIDFRNEKKEGLKRLIFE